MTSVQWHGSVRHDDDDVLAAAGREFRRRRRRRRHKYVPDLCFDCVSVRVCVAGM